MITAYIHPSAILNQDMTSVWEKQGCLTVKSGFDYFRDHIRVSACRESRQVGRQVHSICPNTRVKGDVHPLRGCKEILGGNDGSALALTRLGIQRDVAPGDQER